MYPSTQVYTVGSSGDRQGCESRLIEKVTLRSRRESDRRVEKRGWLGASVAVVIRAHVKVDSLGRRKSLHSEGATMGLSRLGPCGGRSGSGWRRGTQGTQGGHRGVLGGGCC